MGTTTLDTLSMDARETQWDELHIFWARTPVLAAWHAARLGLLEAEGLLRVCRSAKMDLEALAVCHPDFARWEERCAEFNEDFRAAADFIALKHPGHHDPDA